ncbi:MAG: Gfo/Idh/MocA family oxidoreductase [Armatimonadota bacterium]|nr:Gfo/Idh/MocA family oxidoreductase [Armatimonadota bacterium]
MTDAAEHKQARLAFIGAGGFATSAIYPQIHKLPQIDLVAVCDLVREKAERNARNFGARRVYVDLNKMLDEEDLDGVFVIGPAPQQYELAPAVLRRGIPVYVEKPSANTAGEAKELAQFAEENSTWGQCGFMKRFCYVYRMAKDIIARDEFGPLNMVTCHFGQGPYPQIWGMESAKRSMLVGQLVHIFDLTRFFGGDVASLSAIYHEVDENRFAFLVNLHFKSGAVGQLDLNGLETVTGFRDIREWVKLVGLGSHVICEDMQRLRWQAQTDWSDLIPATGRYTHTYDPAWTGIADARANFGYLGEVEHFALKCIGERDGGPDLWDSYEALRIAEAVYDATESGETMEL